MPAPSCVPNVNKQGVPTRVCCFHQESWEQVPRSGSAASANGLQKKATWKKLLSTDSAISGILCFIFSNFLMITLLWSIECSSMVKESAFSPGDLGSNPGWFAVLNSN